MSDEEIEEETSDEEAPVEVEVSPIAGIGTLVFGKWDTSEVTCEDPGISPNVNIENPSGFLHAEEAYVLVGYVALILSVPLELVGYIVQQHQSFNKG